MGKRRASVSSGSDTEIAHKAAKKTKTSSGVISPAGKDDEGNAFWELSSKRRVGVSEFKNACLIHIREYYEKDGKALPSKKGISLSLEQYTTLLKLVPSINSKLREMGRLADTPEDVEDASPVVLKKQKKEKSDKANIDATSDEDEG